MPVPSSLQVVEDETADARERQWISIAFTAAVSLLLGLAWVLWLRRRRQDSIPEQAAWRNGWADISQIQGLSEAEAEARRLEVEDTLTTPQISSSTGDIWRRNLLSIFNLNLIGLSIALLLLGQPKDALTSAAGALFGIVLGVRQQLVARNQLEQVAAATRPEATVIRGGKVRTINPFDVVRGDVLLVGPGDQIFADGQVIGKRSVVVQESVLTGQSTRITVRAGETVRAGSFCVEGRAAFQAKQVGGEGFAEMLSDEEPENQANLTPLQALMERILRILLVVVAVFVVASLASYLFADTGFLTTTYEDYVSMAFGIAPTGLFFMFLITYAVAAADIAKLGAVVKRGRSVEALANVTVICFGKTSGLTGVNVQLEEMDLSANDDGMTQRRVRRVLGDFAHSVSTTGLVNQSIAQEFAGERRRALEEAPHVSAHGWYAIAFDETDLRGVYVLGDAEFLEPNLLQDVTDPQLAAGPGEDTPEETGARGLAGRFAGAFRRGKQETDAQEEETAGRENGTPSTVDRLENDQPAAEIGTPQTELQLAPTEMAEKPSYFKGLLQRAQSALSRADGPNDQPGEETDAERERELYRLLFAYLPEPTSLHNADGSPNLPSDLIPLCHLRLVEQVREEAIDAIQTLTEEGVEIKILASAPAKAVAATAAQLGLGTGDASELDVVSGRDLEEMDSSHFSQAITKNAVFGGLAPEQTGQIVQALRDRGETVAMVGDGVNHVTALRNANVKITIQSASQVALSIADIVLLNDSLAVLSQVMRTGQRIVNGMLDMLKLSMVQVFYVAIFLTATLFIGFPYAPEQGSFINIFTLSLPAMGLSLWAATGAKPTSVQASRIRHFVFPAAVTMSVAALGINFLFRTTTGDMAYAELATAYTIVACGLLLVVFVQPPTKAWVGGDVLNGDKRHLRMVLLLLIAFVVISPFPPAMHFLHTAPLRQLSDYGVIGLGVLCWAIVLRTIWRSRFFRGGLQLNDDEKGQFREHDAGLEMVG